MADTDRQQEEKQPIDPALLLLLQGGGKLPERLAVEPEENRIYGDPPKEGAKVDLLPPRGQSRDVVIGGLSDRVDQRQGQVAAIRKKPISQELEKVLNYAAHQTGVYVAVTSGGQAEAGSGEARTGSTRHNHGNAADLKLFVIGKDGKARYLDFTSFEGQVKFKEFVKAAASAGATGIGAGENYMGKQTMHVGFGKVATWGENGGKGAAPQWLQDAFKEGRDNPVKLVSAIKDENAANDPHFDQKEPGHAEAANAPQYTTSRGDWRRLKAEHGIKEQNNVSKNGKENGKAGVAKQGVSPAVKPVIATVPT